MLTTLRTAITRLFTPLPPPCHPALTPPTTSPDVHLHARLSALHRHLSLTSPLPPRAASALRLLSRGPAPVPPSFSQCPICSGPTRPPPPPPCQPVPALWRFLSLLLFFLMRLIAILARYCAHQRALHRRRRAFRHTRTALEAAALRAKDYAAWHAASKALDEIEGRPYCRNHFALHLCNVCAEVWRARALDRQRAADHAHGRVDTVCDVQMIDAKLRQLASLYQHGDIHGVAFALRAGLARNLGGMCHPELHACSRVATCLVVEDYVHVVSYLLAYIAQPPFIDAAVHETSIVDKVVSGLTTRTLSTSSSDTLSHLLHRTNLSTEDKVTFLNEARHAYGRTALMLSGGALMGLNHLGVVKCLLDQRLLPKVVCGTSAGALVASIVGIFNDSDISAILKTEALINPITQLPFSFRYFDEHTSILTRIRRFLRKGFIQDVHMLQDCLRKNYGDLTFEEAYAKTRRILNITVCPLRTSSDPPLLLNYLTAPHVLIWSAASASCALPLVFAPVELVAKSATGHLIPYHPDGARWIDGSISSDVPLSRIGELFNVNHFIVSQTNPHVIPRSLPIMQTRLAVLLKSELQFRYWQAVHMGLVPKLLTSIFPHFMQPYAGDVTIMPDVKLSDLTNLLSNPKAESVMAFVRRGETQTFPFLDRIRLHCLIEQTLDNAAEFVATTANGDVAKHSSSSSQKDHSIFGRVPSWLWLDNRSILTSGTMSAVARRLTGARQNEDEEECTEVEQLSDLDELLKQISQNYMHRECDEAKDGGSFSSEGSMDDDRILC